MIDCDEQKIKIIVDNLLSNAVKFSLAGRLYSHLDEQDSRDWFNWILWMRGRALMRRIARKYSSRFIRGGEYLTAT